MVKSHLPNISQEELLARTKLGHGLMMFMRGVPVIYSGDEQGFVSDGGDQLAREPLFPSQTGVYNDNDLIGTAATTADSNFDQSHPLYRYIAETAAIRTEHAAFRRGAMETRLFEVGGKDGTGRAFAFSRFDPDTGREYIVVANTGAEPLRINSRVEPNTTDLTSLFGDCPRILGMHITSSYF